MEVIRKEKMRKGRENDWDRRMKRENPGVSEKK
jgi:hypothetical protein